jgi:hypothetical protein
LRAAEIRLREGCAGAAWELATARLMGCVSLFFLGEIRELSSRLPELLANAQARGDLYESTDLRIRIAHAVHLQTDRPDLAAAEVDAALAQWPAGRFYLQHWWALLALVEIAIYRGDAREAWRLMNAQWGPLQRSLLMGIQYIRIESRFHRAAAALEMAAIDTPHSASWIARTLADARRIERERGAPWAAPFAALIRAGAATQPNDAIALMSAAEAGFERADMRLFAASARRRRGEWTGDSALVEQADVLITGEGILNPERMAAMLAPRGVGHNRKH